MPPERRSVTSSLARLRGTAFHRLEKCRDVVKDLLAQRRKIGRHFAAEDIWKVHDWLLCPLTLWAVDYIGLAKHIAGELKAGREFDADLLLLLRVLERPPSLFTQQQIGEYEKTVESGLYDFLTKQPEKFKETESRHFQDRDLRNYWARIKSRFDLKRYGNARGVIRRTLSRERNFEPHLRFSWKARDKERRFRILFDALCYRWCLYGFENDKPLLLKISVNPTPHGTMIVIPRHWSLDSSRDIDWLAVSTVHKAHGTPRQGPKLSSGRIARDALKATAHRLLADARKQGLRGKPKDEFILKAMGENITRRTWLKRLLTK